jgi:hypothetical protein
MDLIAEITNKVASLSPEQQREALALIEKLAARHNESPPASRSNLTPLKGATAREGKQPLTAEVIETARREMWSGFYDDEDGK